MITSPQVVGYMGKFYLLSEIELTVTLPRFLLLSGIY